MKISQTESEHELVTAFVDEGAQGTAQSIPKADSAAVSRRPEGLLTKENSRALSEKSDRAGLIYFCAHFGLIGLGAWATWQTFPGIAFVPVLLVHSFVIGFLFSPLHECAHTTAFKTRWLNEAALWIVAVVYIVPPYFFRYFHLGHHRFTQVQGKDPSLVLPEPATFKQYLWYCGGLWFWWRNITWIAKHAVGVVDPSSADYVPKRKLGLMVREARILTAVYFGVAIVAVATGAGPALLLCWLLPRFLGEPVQRIIRVAEHVGCEESSDLLSNTRTTKTNWLLNALAWQMPYHAEHHLFPNVPFFRLPALHRVVADKVVVEPRGYIAGQRDIIAMLRSQTAAANSTQASRPVL